MTKRIFRAICLVALAVFLAALACIMGVLYSHFTQVQREQLKIQTDLAARGVALNGLDYFEALSTDQYRVTWVDTQGNVLFDTDTEATRMENHLQREEIREALEAGTGESTRYSATLMERSMYYAELLPDGTVLRLSMAQNSVLTLLLGILQPICVVIALALVLSMVLAGRISRNIVKPLNRLDLDDPTGCDAYDELAPLLHRIDSQQKQLRLQSADLRRRQQEFEAVTANMSEGLVLLGKNNVILSINPAAAGFLGADPSCTGTEFCEVCRNSRIHALLNTAREGQHREITLTLADRDYQLDASPVDTEEGITGLVLLIFDVTEKERAEQLRREFTANVSHELKTPLHAISGYAELMAKGIAKPGDMTAFSESIYAEAQRMIALIGDILRLSELDEGGTGLVWIETDLYLAARQELEALSSAARKGNVTLTLEGSPASLRSVPQLLSAVLHNLCDNAIKYNHPGGSVTVTVEEEVAECVLTVADTGIGIPPEDQSRIFERFYRVDKSRSKEVGGTGLGLSIVKHAGRILNARIDLQSTPGKGTTITVRFPKT